MGYLVRSSSITLLQTTLHIMHGVVQLLAVVAMAACVRGADQASACCMSNKWHGKMMQVGAMEQVNQTAQVVDNMFMMDYDYDRKMIRLIGTSRDPMTGMKHSLTVLDDYMNGKSYNVYDGHCMVSDQDGIPMVPPCIPGNFTYEGSYMLGSGVNSLLVKIYDGYNNNMASRWALTSDCTPVTMSEYGTSPLGTGMVYSFVFADTVQGKLSESDPFVVPMGCQTMPSTVG